MRTARQWGCGCSASPPAVHMKHSAPFARQPAVIRPSARPSQSTPFGAVEDIVAFQALTSTSQKLSCVPPSGQAMSLSLDCELWLAAYIVSRAPETSRSDPLSVVDQELKSRL